MDINQLCEIVKKKIETNLKIEKIIIEDKTFLHKNHLNHENGKSHLKVIIKSKYLESEKKINISKKIFKLIDHEIKNYIHSIQLKIN